MWFGGIGTYIKAPGESNAEVSDRANDALRIDSGEIRAKVVGEGANLGVTQRGRVAYALAGGRIDTDAIDNSAGVDTSDHEVNLKILVDRAIAAGVLPAEEREPLLQSMADEVAALVLRDNYLQGEALSVAEARGGAALDRQARLIRELEIGPARPRARIPARRRGLGEPRGAPPGPDSPGAFGAARLCQDGARHRAPRLRLARCAAACRRAAELFPGSFARAAPPAIPAHPMRREITATIVTNDLVNRAGMTFVSDMRARTGRPPPDIARAYLIVREIFDMPRLWAEIEALDNRAPAQVQTEMLLEIATVVERSACWLLQRRRLDLAGERTRLTPPIRALAASLASLLPQRDQAIAEERSRRLAAAAVPEALAAQIGRMPFLAPALDIAELAEQAAQPLDRTAAVYYAIGVRFALDEMRAATRRLPAETQWQKLAVEATIDDLLALQADITSRVLASEHAAAADPLAGWTSARSAELAAADSFARELRASAAVDLALLVVAARQLRQALD